MQSSTCKQHSILETMFIKRVQALSLRFFKETVQYQQSHYRKQVRVSFFLLNSSFKSSIQNIVIKASGRPPNSPRTTWRDCCFLRHLPFRWMVRWFRYRGLFWFLFCTGFNIWSYKRFYVL